METFFGIDLVLLITTIGYLGLFAIAFADSGLLIGILLPGDSLLFTAGFLASQGYLNVSIVIIVCFIGAVLGDSVGYAFGKRFGPRIFKREDSFLLNKRQIERAQVFYAEHGGKTIILARFVHFVRTLAPMLAGVGGMPYRIFLAHNIIGGFLWVFGVTLLGFYAGELIPNADRYILVLIGIIIVLSFTPTAMRLFKARQVQREAIM